MKKTSTYNSEIRKLEKFLKEKERTEFKNDYIILLFDEKPNARQIVFKSSVIVEFYNLKEEIVNINHKDCRIDKDEFVPLEKLNITLSTSKLETKFSRYSNHIVKEELDRLFADVSEFWKNQTIATLVKFSPSNPRINLVLNLKLYLFKENLNSFITMGLKTNPTLITDKSKLVYAIIKHLQTGLKKENLLKPLGNLIVNNCPFNVSKSSADSYICKKIDFLNDVLESWGFPKVLPEIEYDYSDDFRINTGLQYYQILDYFMQLNVENKSTNKLILSEEDIKQLVNSNFVSRENPVIKRKLLNVNIVKSDLKRFVYEFYKYKDSNHFVRKREIYLDFLICNFTLFMDDTIDTLKAHFPHPPRIKYPFISLGK